MWVSTLGWLQLLRVTATTVVGRGWRQVGCSVRCGQRRCLCSCCLSCCRYPLCCCHSCRLALPRNVLKSCDSFELSKHDQVFPVQASGLLIQPLLSLLLFLSFCSELAQMCTCLALRLRQPLHDLVDRSRVSPAPGHPFRRLPLRLCLRFRLRRHGLVKLGPSRLSEV